MMNPPRIFGFIPLWLLLTLLVMSGTWYVVSPTISRADKNEDTELESYTPLPSPTLDGRYIFVQLENMILVLHDGTSTETVPIISLGKPGSYYETIGGSYVNDYKIPLHFSSIGHVYMPHSIHIFGNYFIHGIPYYPDGAKVSSTYSGGCIRLSDEDATKVYNFVKLGTPIIISKGSEHNFTQTGTTTPNVETLEMTRLMTATISLEVLSQDNKLRGPNGLMTTRRELLPSLLRGDTTLGTWYAKALGEKTFVLLMNQKAKTIGLTNTTFTSVTDPALTTAEDYERFLAYITTYKSYLLSLFPTEAVLH